MSAPKGHPRYGGGSPKGTKYKKTLEKEELRHALEAKAAEKWKTIVDSLIKNEKKYVVDQVIGKANERVQIQTDVNLKIDL